MPHKILESLQQKAAKAVRKLPRTKSDPGQALIRPVMLVKPEGTTEPKRDCSAKRYSITFESNKTACGKGPAIVQ